MEPKFEFYNAQGEHLATVYSGSVAFHLYHYLGQREPIEVLEVRKGKVVHASLR